MIFSEGFDKTLYIILESDKEYNEKIVNFINKIPSELIQKIRMKIEQAKLHNLKNDSFKYHVDETNNDNQIYNFDYKISRWGIELVLKYIKVNKDNKSETFELILFDFDSALEFKPQPSLFLFSSSLGFFEYESETKYFSSTYNMNVEDDGYYITYDHTDDNTINHKEHFILESNLPTDIKFNMKGITRILK